MTATTTLPNPINGYFFAIACLVLEFAAALYGEMYKVFHLIVVLSGCAYYLWNVYLIHKILIETVEPTYETSPAKAVGYHFIPIYNAYWLYSWQNELLSVILFKGDDPKLKFGLVLGLMYGGLVFIRFDFAIGYAIFWTGFIMMARAFSRMLEARGFMPVVENSGFDGQRTV